MNLPEKMKILFLDDARKPNDVFGPFIEHEDVQVIIATNYDEFVDLVREHDAQFHLVSFDHDLGDEGEQEKTGKDCAYFLLEHCVTNDKPVPKFSVHSSNPSGSDRINQMLSKYSEFVPPKNLK